MGSPAHVHIYGALRHTRCGRRAKRPLFVVASFAWALAHADAAGVGEPGVCRTCSRSERLDHARSVARIEAVNRRVAKVPAPRRKGARRG